jgi:hypothetical protein
MPLCGEIRGFAFQRAYRFNPNGVFGSALKTIGRNAFESAFLSNPVQRLDFDQQLTSIYWRAFYKSGLVAFTANRNAGVTIDVTAFHNCVKMVELDLFVQGGSLQHFNFLDDYGAMFDAHLNYLSGRAGMNLFVLGGPSQITDNGIYYPTSGLLPLYRSFWRQTTTMEFFVWILKMGSWRRHSKQCQNTTAMSWRWQIPTFQGSATFK